jgi:hypothetical protein
MVAILEVTAAMTTGIDRDGYAVVDDVVTAGGVGELLLAIAAAGEARGPELRQKAGRVYAVRDLLSLVPAVRTLADSPEVRGLVEPVLGSDARPVRGLLFDKTPGANWKVAWHQDLSIAVRRRWTCRDSGRGR